jgi:hypothetical protein
MGAMNDALPEGDTILKEEIVPRHGFNILIYLFEVLLTGHPRRFKLINVLEIVCLEMLLDLMHISQNMFFGRFHIRVSIGVQELHIDKPVFPEQGSEIFPPPIVDMKWGFHEFRPVIWRQQ